MIERYAAQLGWSVARTNVIVEGTSDLALLGHAAVLYEETHGTKIIDADFAIHAAGLGDDGGVHGVSRGLIAMRQVADVDRDDAGALRFRFFGLFDNDHAGKSAFNLLTQIDPRIERFKDIFLLQPVMPAIGDGLSDRLLEATQANLSYSGMDWEIEDLCSERLLAQFEQRNPGAVLKRESRGTFIHRDFDKKHKSKLTRFFIEEAKLEDAERLISLIKLMRGYFGVQHEFINI